MKKKAFCDITKDPNILEFVSMFAEQHDVVISFTFLGLAGFNVYMGKNGNLEFIMLPREELEIIDRHAMGSVLNDLLMRLETKNEYCERIKEEGIKRMIKLAEEEVKNAEHKSN